MNAEQKSENLWCLSSTSPLSFDDALSFVRIDKVGAVVLFSGDVRDHSDGRVGVSSLEYEAYESQLIRSFVDLGNVALSRFEGTCRIAIFHRIGKCAVGESTVVIVASAEHRESAFSAAKFCIDTLKVTSPIWKKETWDSGSDWALGANQIQHVEEV